MRPRSRLSTSYDGHHDSANGKTTEKATTPRVCTCAWLHCGTTAINLESLPGIIEQTARNASAPDRPRKRQARTRFQSCDNAPARTTARLAWLPSCLPDSPHARSMRRTSRGKPAFALSSDCFCGSLRGTFLSFLVNVYIYTLYNTHCNGQL